MGITHCNLPKGGWSSRTWGDTQGDDPQKDVRVSPWGMEWGGIIGPNCHQSLNLSHQMRWFDVISGYFGAVLHFQAAALPNKKAVSMERLKAWAIRGIYWLICWPQCSIGFGNLFHTCDRQCRVLTFKTWSIAFYCNSVQYSMEFCTCICIYIYRAEAGGSPEVNCNLIVWIWKMLILYCVLQYFLPSLESLPSVKVSTSARINSEFVRAEKW